MQFPFIRREQFFDTRLICKVRLALIFLILTIPLLRYRYSGPPIYYTILFLYLYKKRKEKEKEK
jgi:hypothetical protein